MNLDGIKCDIKKNIGKYVQIVVYGMRNKREIYTGHICAVYPNIFSITFNGKEKSFMYSEVGSGDAKIKYL